MKKGLIIILFGIVLGIMVAIVQTAVENVKKNRLERHVISEYNFEISYPTSYQNAASEEVNEEIVSSNIKVSVSGEDVDEYMKNINKTEKVLDLIDTARGIKMYVDAISIEKTSLPLKEICDRYVVMFRIYNEDATITEKEDTIENLNGIDVGKVVLTIKGKEANSKVIAYLFSLEDKEITLTFITPEESYQKYGEQMEKIAKSIKNIEK